jgi:hypothetical protein
LSAVLDATFIFSERRSTIVFTILDPRAVVVLQYGGSCDIIVSINFSQPSTMSRTVVSKLKAWAAGPFIPLGTVGYLSSPSRSERLWNVPVSF